VGGGRERRLASLASEKLLPCNKKLKLIKNIL
jgi:hypothetical protein